MNHLLLLNLKQSGYALLCCMLWEEQICYKETIKGERVPVKPVVFSKQFLFLFLNLSIIWGPLEPRQLRKHTERTSSLHHLTIMLSCWRRLQTKFRAWSCQILVHMACFKNLDTKSDEHIFISDNWIQQGRKSKLECLFNVPYLYSFQIFSLLTYQLWANNHQKMI